MGNQIANNAITITKKVVRQQGGVVVLPLKKWQRFEKEKSELYSALEAILAGELALRARTTRSFREFIKSEFPQYAKNF